MSISPARRALIQDFLRGTRSTVENVVFAVVFSGAVGALLYFFGPTPFPG